MCFHWKSLRRQVRIIGRVEEVTRKEADDYYNSRPYKNRIGAWASSQSQTLDKRATFLEKIKEFEKKYPDENNVPRPYIGPDGEFYLMKLNFGSTEKEEFMRD